MKKYGLLIIWLIFCFTFSCEDDDNYGSLDPVNPVVKDISNSDCKEFDIKCTKNEDCVNYFTIDENYLKFKRVNVAFNCCIDSVIINVDLNGNDTIIITETENAGYCDCNCLYDIEYTIGPLNYGQYNILIDEQYHDTISFYIDFNKNTDGQYCEERSGYPWE